jgi:hypothetical protein
MERRLAAIVAADVVGYSRLMQADEAGTHAALKARRTTMQPLIARHRGRIVKLMGDGVLIEFASAVHAIEFAVVEPPSGPGRVSSDERGNMNLWIASESMPGANNSDSLTSRGAPSAPAPAKT